MKIEKAIEYNIFRLYSNGKKYETATTELKEVADQLIKVVKKHVKSEANYTESIESILEYIRLGGKLYID